MLACSTFSGVSDGLTARFAEYEADRELGYRHCKIDFLNFTNKIFGGFCHEKSKQSGVSF